jgi:2-methylcitrate dehydratase PrpD
MTIAETYATYCANLAFDDLPGEVVEYAKRLTLDTIGVMAGAVSYTDSSGPIAAGIRALDANGDGATVIATGERMSPAYAGFLNGALAHSLDYDDTHRASSLHPGAPVIAAALAAGESADATGEELLTGIIAGYEVICRLGMAIDADSHYARGFHGTATCGTFGATGAAGSILGLTADELEAAFGVNGSQASGSLQFLANGGWNKRIHPGLAVHSALLSVELAREEFHAASKPIQGERGIFTGYTDDPKPHLATRGLGEEYEILQTAVKPYPCCRYMHAPLDLLLDLVDADAVDSTDVTDVTINLPSAGIRLVGSSEEDYPRSFVDAQFSMRFGSALVFTEHDAGIDSFTETVEAPYTGEFTRLFDATTVEPSGDVDALYPEKWAARVVVETTSGTYDQTTEYARGEPEKPLSEAAFVNKFEELLADQFDADAARECILSVENHDAADVVGPFA